MPKSDPKPSEYLAKLIVPVTFDRAMRHAEAGGYELVKPERSVKDQNKKEAP